MRVGNRMADRLSVESCGDDVKGDAMVFRYDDINSPQGEET